MTKTRTLTRSFAGGELAPELEGRIDLDKYQAGLRLCVNFITLPHGPAQSRSGFRYVNEVKDSSKRTCLLRFSFSTDDTVIIEAGEGYFRFHTNGGTVLEAAKAIVTIAGDTLTITTHGYAAGQWLFIGGRFYRITSAPDADTVIVQNLDGSTATPSGSTAARVYEVANGYLEGELFDIHYVQSSDVMTLVHPSHPIKELRRTSVTNWQFTDANFDALLTPPTGLGSTASTAGGTTNTITYTYVATALDETGIAESEASSSTSVVNNLGQFTNYNQITWSAVAGASRYNVYRERGGVYGYIGQTSGLSFIDDNIVPDVSKTPPTYVNPFDDEDKYPSAVSYFDQRRCFAATNLLPSTVFMTRPGTEGNYAASFPTVDNDPITFKIAALEQNRIRHLIPLADLVALTAGGEYRIFNGSGEPVTPSTVVARPQSYIGASNVQPMVTSISALYVQAQGSHLRELTYDSQGNGGYNSEDISVLTPHLVNGYTIQQLAYCRGPIPLLWAVRNDGVLLGLTYEPTQRIRSWHRHITANGAFESVACVAEGNEDALYAIVRRTINGRTVRYIERLESQYFADTPLPGGAPDQFRADNVFRVDCGLTYTGAPVTTISGLWHLEGQEVSILADGAVFPKRVVTNGNITLQNAASKVHIGLPIDAYIETLPASFEAQAGGQGLGKNITRVYLRVDRSSAVFAGPDFGRLVEYKQRTTEPYGQPPALISGEIEIPLVAKWGRDGTVVVRQTDPLPLTIQSMVLEIAVGG